MTYHITYSDRTGAVHTGRVSIARDPMSSAALQRSRAIQAAAWKYPETVRRTISAVAVRSTM